MNPIDRRPRRRGMLLLMVLLMLALFMAIGAMLLTIALRSRAAARAAMAAGEPSSQNEVMICEALDEALMAALRGAKGGTNGSVLFGGTLENLLWDKYGPALTSGSGAILSGSAAPAGTNSGTPVMPIGLSLSNPAVGQPAQLRGRILTINPRLGDGEIMSFRILAATGTSGTASGTTTCLVAQLPSLNPRPLPSGTFGVVVNGREFTPTTLPTGTTKPYDAYDDANRWLAQPTLAGGNSSGSVRRMSFVGLTGTSGTTTPIVDNDNDGIPDGTWFPSDTVLNAAIASGSATPTPYVLADRPSPLGGTLRFQVSYLILDLDGRINVNAAGITASQGDYANTPNVPIGMGYGPADINVSGLFPLTVGGTISTGTATAPITLSAYWQNLLLGGTPTATPAVPTAAQRRQPPVVGPVSGRYGPNAVPNGDGDQLGFGQRTSGGPNSMYSLTTSGNSVGDLKAQTRVYMEPPVGGSLTPTLNYYRTAWTGTAGTDHIEDPYEVRLDADAPRFGGPRRASAAGDSNDDLPFSVAELERVLRPNDSDTSQLPQRLAAGLEDHAQRNRLTITTESWDAPALTGLAALQVENFMARNGLLSGTSATTYDPALWSSGSIPASPDIASGLRFDINRVITGVNAASVAAAKQDYCKGLYTLVMALATGTANTPPPPADVAQWVANVMDFRDDDSTMTRFQYDTDLTDGWQLDGASPLVYGAERPEVVITETGAWKDGGSGQLFVVLHRPSAQALLKTLGSGSTTITTGTTELPAAELLVSGTLDLAKTHDNNANGSPVWRLRFSSDDFVYFSDIGNPPPAPGNAYGSSNATGSVPLAVDGYLCVCPAPPHQRFNPAVTEFNIDRPSAAGFQSDGSRVSLERLADPTQPYDASTNPYVAMDAADVKVLDFSGGMMPAVEKTRRKFPAAVPNDPFTHRLAAFWRSEWENQPSGSLGTYSVSGTNPVAWFHWPNRGFVGNAELALVPTGTSSTGGLLTAYSFPTNSLANSATTITVSALSGTTTTTTTTTLGALILDATTVPSRFADNALTVTHPSVNTVGLDGLPRHNMSRWREPGRVNVNTIVTGTTVTGSNAPVNIVWTTFISGTQFQVRSGTNLITVTSNTFSTSAGSVSPATSLAHVLSLNRTGTTSPPPIAVEEFVTSGTLNPRDKNPYFALARAIRLSNTATVRSNVFAVWITVRVTDDSPNAPSPVTKRLFAIIDRSIPVGYTHNRDLNVRDTIKLKRYLD